MCEYRMISNRITANDEYVAVQAAKITLDYFTELAAEQQGTVDRQQKTAMACKPANVKRVFDTFVSNAPADSDQISTYLGFILNLARCHNDPFGLFNISTINLILAKANTSLIHNTNHKVADDNTNDEALDIILLNTLKHIDELGLKIKVGLLENLVIYINHVTTEPTIQHATGHALSPSITQIIEWTYGKYKQFWMQDNIKLITIRLINELKENAAVPVQVYDLVASVLQLYPDQVTDRQHLAQSFVNKIEAIKKLILGNRVINQLDKLINQWQLSHGKLTYDEDMYMPMYIVDGRNRFYTNKGIDCVSLSAFQSQIAGTAARVMYVFSEKHRGDITKMCTKDTATQCIFAPRGIDDDLLTIYLWLSNPTSFVVTEDSYSNHACKLVGNKYLEGLWHNWLARFRSRKFSSDK